MFTNTKACTIYEKTVRNRAPTYIRHIIRNIYCEITHGQLQEQSGAGTNRSPQNGVFCMIPAKSILDYIPKKDDRIVCGLCEEEQPPQTAFTVMQVKDFRYGSKRVQHLEVSAV